MLEPRAIAHGAIHPVLQRGIGTTRSSRVEARTPSRFPLGQHKALMWEGESHRDSGQSGGEWEFI